MYAILHAAGAIISSVNRGVNPMYATLRAAMNAVV